MRKLRKSLNCNDKNKRKCIGIFGGVLGGLILFCYYSISLSSMIMKAQNYMFNYVLRKKHEATKNLR